MLNTWLIAKREYLERIRAKSFLIMTILIPILMGGLVYGAALANGRSGSHLRIAVVTQDRQFGLDLKSELENSKESTKEGTTTVDVISPPASDTRDILDQKLKGRSLDGYIWVTPPSTPHTRAPVRVGSQGEGRHHHPSLAQAGHPLCPHSRRSLQRGNAAA